MTKILLVDDEPTISTLTRIMLENEGYKVTEVQDGAECLEILGKQSFDLILLDVRMPGEDGWEICKKIKADKKTLDIPVVMFTVRSSLEDVKRSKEAGAIFQINKPFASEELLGTVKKALKKS